MKRKLQPLFACVPFLIEYCSTPEEEDEIDLLQARKYSDFKRMMLESVKQGGGVGLPVPIGYDDIQVTAKRLLEFQLCFYYSLILDRTLKAGRCCRPLRWTTYTALQGSLLLGTTWRTSLPTSR
jgi:hypothetical protein